MRLRFPTRGSGALSNASSSSSGLRNRQALPPNAGPPPRRSSRDPIGSSGKERTPRGMARLNTSQRTGATCGQTAQICRICRDFCPVSGQNCDNLRAIFRNLRANARDPERFNRNLQLTRTTVVIDFVERFSRTDPHAP